MPQTKRSEVTQRLQRIHRVPDVAKEDVIEFLTRLELLPELVFIRESDREFERRILLPRDFHDLSAQVYSFPSFGRNRSQMKPRTATNRKDFLLRLDQEPEKAPQGLVIIAIASYPALATRSDSCQLSTGAGAPLLQGRCPPVFLVRFALVYCRFHWGRHSRRRRKAPDFRDYCERFRWQNFLQFGRDSRFGSSAGLRVRFKPAFEATRVGSFTNLIPVEKRARCG